MTIQPTDYIAPPAQAEVVLSVQIEKAKLLATASLLPPAYAKNPANVLVAMEAAQALGVTLFQAIQGITVINGRMSMSAEFMRALVTSKGHMIEFEEPVTDQECTVVVARRERPNRVQRFTFTMADAKQAGLTGEKTNYHKHPKAMLMARATTMACRAVFPDVIAGIGYTPDELADLMPIPEPGTTRTATQTPAPMVVEPMSGKAEWDALAVAFAHMEETDGRDYPPSERYEIIAALLGLDHIDSLRELTKQQAVDAAAALTPAAPSTGEIIEAQA